MKACRLIVLPVVFAILALSACAPSAPSSPPAPAAPAVTAAAPTAAATVAPAAPDTSAPTATPAETAQAVRPTRAPSRSLTKTIPAPSKAQNLVGEPAEGEITVYLPPSYYTSDRRYPVVYYLPGFGDSGMIGMMLPRDIDDLIAANKMKEMIVVVAPGQSVLGGSFYANSPVTGNWDDYITKDVVGYVDANFRTLAEVASRGITGHSMGGFGAINLGMLHPDVFSAVYSMSPGLFDANGLAESQMFDSQRAIDNYLAKAGELAKLSPEDASKAMKALYSDTQFTIAYGATFSPDPTGKPPYIVYPVAMVDGKPARDEKVWKAWDAGYGGVKEKLAAYKDNPLKLTGLAVDCGNKDEYHWIPKGCTYFAQQAKAAGVPAELVIFDGDHQGYLTQRITEQMLPFFSKTLAGAQ